MDAFERICALVEQQTGRPLSGGKDQKKGICPAHEDQQASLSVRRSEPVGVTCFAGCEFEDIRDALGLRASDFRNGPAIRKGGKRPEPRKLESSRGTSGDNSAKPGNEVARYPYTDPDGTIRYYNVRFEPKAFRMAGPDGRVSGLPKDLARLPYNLPNVLAAIQQGQTVFWVEGEKDVATLARDGKIGTTAAGGASAQIPVAWRQYLAGADLVVVADNDDVGRAYARRVARAFVDVTAACRVVTVGVQRPKADLTDHREAGLGYEDLVFQDRWVRRTRFDFNQIMAVPSLQIRWLLNGLIPQESGVCLLVGAPKAGKSWFCLQLYLAVASGDFHQIFGWGGRTEPATVLYLALEDNAPRINSRLRQMQSDIELDIPDISRRGSQIWLEITDLDSGGTDDIRTWLDHNPDARLVIVDVLAKVRSDSGEGNAYQADYTAINQLKEIADEYGVTFVVTHHDRKLKHNGDFFDQISGTKGITGAADTILYLKRDRGSSQGYIDMSGRDVEECRYTMEFAKEQGRWDIVGKTDIDTGQGEQQPRESTHDILARLVSTQGSLTIDDAMAATGKDRATIYRAAQNSVLLVASNGVIATRNGHG